MFKYPTSWIFSFICSNGFTAAKIESRFSIPVDLEGERHLEETRYLYNYGRPPKSKRRKRKSHALQLIYHYIMFYESLKA